MARPLDTRRGGGPFAFAVPQLLARGTPGREALCTGGRITYDRARGWARSREDGDWEVGKTMRVVTIDGPAGAGKSTVARRLADRLGWRLLDTGAMYRAVTLAALRAGVDLESDRELGDLAARVTVQLPPGRVLLDGEDISAIVRGVEITRASRHLADSPSVRRCLVTWQRDFAAETDVVAEGRDQGTVVFPDAFRKFFLTASPEERARRRHAEFSARGETVALDVVLRDIRERDDRDENRAIAPMRPADDARVIDSTGLDPDRVVALLEDDILARS